MGFITCWIALPDEVSVSFSLTRILVWLRSWACASTSYLHTSILDIKLHDSCRSWLLTLYCFLLRYDRIHQLSVLASHGDWNMSNYPPQCLIQWLLCCSGSDKSSVLDAVQEEAVHRQVDRFKTLSSRINLCISWSWLCSLLTDWHEYCVSANLVCVLTSDVRWVIVRSGSTRLRPDE